MPETTYSKGADRIMHNSVAKKQLRSIVTKYATYDDAPTHLDTLD